MDGLAAALDLGSNSFHLIIARVDRGELIALERLKEKVQLGRGSVDGAMSAAAVQRGLDCVARFAQRLRSIPLDRVSIVGTSALREARNRDAFLEPAQQLLRHPVRILTGEEEAELIFLGVSHALAANNSRRLVIDIGGGSTEFCVGGSFDPQYATSIDLGCVTLTDRRLSSGVSLPTAYAEARREACTLLAPIVGTWRNHARDAVVIGTSGTIESVRSVLIANGFDSGPITRKGITELEREILERRWISDLSVPGLEPERVDIFPAGLAAVSAIFESLNIERMEYVDASLQHGLLYDLTARRALENVQERTVGGWQQRFAVDVEQARRVRALALRMFDAVAGDWGVENGELRDLLGWAADLHEIGLMVSARQPNRHGAYFVENGELPGFSPDERRAIALLIRSHRGGFPLFAFASFSQQGARELKRLAVLLRLAVILERTRTDADSPDVSVEANDDSVRVSIEASWLGDHALSRAELEWEKERLSAVAVTLTIVSAG